MNLDLHFRNTFAFEFIITTTILQANFLPLLKSSWSIQIEDYLTRQLKKMGAFLLIHYSILML